MNTRLRACLLKSSLLFSPSGLEGFLILRSQKIVSKRPTPSSPYGRATAVASPLAPLDLESNRLTNPLGYPELMKRGTQKSKLGAMSVKGSVTLLQNVLTLRRYGRMKEAMNATWSETLEMTLHLKAMRRPSREGLKIKTQMSRTVKNIIWRGRRRACCMICMRKSLFLLHSYSTYLKPPIGMR